MCSTGEERSRQSSRAVLPVLVLVALLAGVTGCGDSDRTVITGTPSPPGSTGVEMSIVSAGIDGASRVVVEFTIEDDRGRALQLSALDDDPQFVLGWIDTDPATRYTRYQSYVVELVAGASYEDGGAMVPPAEASAEQAVTDSGGQFVRIGLGRYRYTSGTTLPAGFDGRATHTVGAYLSRDGGASVDNEVFHFVPAGGAPSVLREVAVTQSCNDCHGALTAHAGVLRDVALCVVCHTDQTVDPESGENLEFGRFIHKIHQGAGLTVLPFFVVGESQTVEDYSDVRYPQDLRNCRRCHDESPGGAAEWENSRTQPARATCGGCHDDLNFETGEGHNDGVAQFDDVFCSTCHRPDLVEEFENSVPGAHILPEESSVDPDLTLAVTDVTGLVPGGQPSVSFTIEDVAGPLDITTLDRVAVTFGGPTSDYAHLLAGSTVVIHGSGATPTLVTNAVGSYTFTPATYLVPAGASGTWSVGLEARTGTITFADRMFRFGANNPVANVDVATGVLGAGAPELRRQVVDAALCNECHETIRAHGDLRVEVEYCVMCHNSWATDEARRPGVSPTNPPETIHFKVMIHKIHRGMDLERGYTVYGFGGTPHDFTEVRYPRPLTNCGACHLDGTEALPLPAGSQATVKNIAGVPVPQEDAISTPAMAACLACHDDEESEEHARRFSNINGPTDWIETCEVCHGTGRVVDAALFHPSSP